MKTLESWISPASPRLSFLLRIVVGRLRYFLSLDNSFRVEPVSQQQRYLPLAFKPHPVRLWLELESCVSYGRKQFFAVLA